MSRKEEIKAGSEATTKAFDIELVCNALQTYNENVNALSLDHYLIAYEELRRFFELLGAVFGFVAKDVDNKIEILKGYRNDEQIKSHYETIQSMFDYESSNNLLKDSKRPSGSRTLLRLHRALEFIMMFMSELSKLENNSATGGVARDCYKKSLAKYHPWYIQKTASVAMYTLPTRQDLIARAFGYPPGDECMTRASEDMAKLARISECCYNITQKLFEERDLLTLP
ncbi:ceramide-1-phosphate transfer protein-like protein [Leptotrombidium deliense]|uniref:Ceramide-1-phosphate transfer protein-like protein n=1 Tax=Leptotrombidium deliense TaxID=299467 RepID=A0A443SQ86_9ACAR|nr:ceramide-1-phosphate transfer protein-like protein [Leptotrombidium deliense]